MWPFGCCPYLYKCGGIAPIKATDEMTQPVGQRNGQLFTTPGGSGSNGIFWAEYGVTSYTDVKNAIDAGKYVVVKKNDRVGVLIDITNTFLLFCASFETHNYIMYLYPNNTWTETDTALEKRGKITIGGVEYTPTRKALAITENGVTTTYYVADVT